MQETDLMSSEAGTQNVTSYWIGFGPDVARGTRFLESVASGGGGQYYTAADTAELTQVFTDIVTRILSQTATFSAPTVAVNAFNRTQNLNFLYMSVFKPSQQYRWLGNVKKYSVSRRRVDPRRQQQPRGRSEHGLLLRRLQELLVRWSRRVRTQSWGAPQAS